MRADPSCQFFIAALVVGEIAVGSVLLLSSCSTEPTSRKDLVKANALLDKNADELTALDKKTYNCYGNGIGKKIKTDPTGYNPIDSDEFKVAMKCGPADYHFIRQLSDGTWNNKSGEGTGLIISERNIINGRYGEGIWFGYTAENG